MATRSAAAAPSAHTDAYDRHTTTRHLPDDCRAPVRRRLQRRGFDQCCFSRAATVSTVSASRANRTKGPCLPRTDRWTVEVLSWRRGRFDD